MSVPLRSAPTLSNHTHLVVKLSTWGPVERYSGLSRTTEVTIKPGDTQPLPGTSTGEFIITGEALDYIGKFRLVSVFKGDLWTGDEEYEIRTVGSSTEVSTSFSLVQKIRPRGCGFAGKSSL